MPWEMWKEVLLPGGRWKTRDGEWFSYSPRQIVQAHRNVNRMLSRGVPIPCTWEHQDVEAGDPEEWKARYAKHTFGHVAGSRINARGGLELLHRGPDERDRDQLLKTRYVSPKLYPGYSDSRGGRYRGTTVAHVAATPTPVMWTQRPFELSRGRALYLSYTPEGDAVADENETTPEGGEGKPAMDADLKALIEALRGKGLNISDKVSNLRELTIAVESCEPAGGDEDEDDEDLGLDDEPQGTTDATTPAAGTGGGPVMMSDARAEPLRKMARRDLENRAQALFRTGRVTRPVAAKLVREARSVELSFFRTGEPAPNALEAKIAAYEELPKGSAWTPTGRNDSRELSTTEVDVPEKLKGAGGDVDPKVLETQERLARNLSAGSTK